MRRRRSNILNIYYADGRCNFSERWGVPCRLVNAGDRGNEIVYYFMIFSCFIIGPKSGSAETTSAIVRNWFRWSLFRCHEIVMCRVRVWELREVFALFEDSRTGWNVCLACASGYHSAFRPPLLLLAAISSPGPTPRSPFLTCASPFLTCEIKKIFNKWIRRSSLLCSLV